MNPESIKENIKNVGCKDEHECLKCLKDYKFCFRRHYDPEQFLEGKASSRVWIVGINPKSKPQNSDSETDPKTLKDLESFVTKKCSYFSHFKIASPRLYELMGQQNGVANTDIVKCFSNEWPPKIGNVKMKPTGIIKNCIPYLEKQLRLLKPDLLICNGTPAYNEIIKIVKIGSREDLGPGEWDKTYYIGEFEGHRTIVIWSGQIGRDCNAAKRRLGIEIEWFLSYLKM